jgi:PAS domain S-box-containing protein
MLPGSKRFAPALRFVNPDREPGAENRHCPGRTRVPRHFVDLQPEREKGRVTAVQPDLAHSISDTAPVIVLELDPAGRIERYNAYMTRVCGYPLEQMRGKDWFEAFVPRAERERIRNVFARAIRGERTQGNVNPIVTRAGEERWIEWFDTVLRDSAGRITGLLATGLDVTERMRAEQSLREKDEFQRAVLDSVSSHNAVLDPTGVIIAVNEPWRRFRAANAPDDPSARTYNDVGTNYLAICRASSANHGEQAAAVADGIEAVLRGQLARFRLEYPCHGPGQERWFTLRVTPLGQTGGGAVVAHTDVTERKRAEQTLRDTEEKFRATFEQAAVGIGHNATDGRWLRVNHKLCEFLGYSAQELLQRSFHDVTFPPDLEVDLQAAGQLLRGEIRTHATRKRYVRRDGQLVWGNRTVSLVRRPDGQPDYFIAVIEDIGERVRAEAELQALRAEMEQLTRFQVASQTVAAIAHELHQPLNAMTAYSEAALRLLRSDAADDERLARAIEGSAEQAQRAGRVVRELLDFLRRGSAEREPLNLNSAVMRALSILRGDHHAGLRTVLRLAPDLPPVLCNRLQIEKVLVNLIQNGLEAMRAAKVPPAAMTIEIETAMREGAVRVSVRDNGSGLDARTLQRMFEPFFTPKPGGLGMGLAISRSIVEGNGGRLWAEQSSPAGACFHVTLPVAS